MIKKIICFVVIITTFFSGTILANENKILNNAIKKFSTSPFNTLYIEGGAFFFGDGISEMPLTMRYNYNKKNDTRRMNAIDGLLGSLIFDLKINKNMLTADIVEWQTNFTMNINSIKIDVPIMRYPKIYSDALSYVFIDTARTIQKKSIKLGKNWHTIVIDYKDRKDTIVFSAKSMRVRTYQTQYYNNIITIDMSSYTNINGVSYPASFVLKSQEDNREIHLTLSTIIDNNDKLSKPAKDFIKY